MSVSLHDAYRLVCDNLKYEPGRFYGASTDLALGAGLIFANVRQPAFDEKLMRYRTVRGPAYVLTHECDVSKDNARPLQDSVLICPVIRFEHFVESLSEHPNLPAFLGDLAARNVFRAAYVPTFEQFPYGGILYLNQITNTHLMAFEEAGAECLCAVSTTGLREIDAALQNLLLREKADLLWGAWLG